MIDIATIFNILDESDKKRISAICKKWESEQILESDISITLEEYEMLFNKETYIKTIKSVTSRTKCSIKVAKAVCDRELAKIKGRTEKKQVVRKKRVSLG